jgi:ribosome-associated heat shock protein Hsp15
MNEAAETCRIDIWLWRARFFKTRSLAARFVSDGEVRLSRGGVANRPDKPSRTVRSGDRLIFAIGRREIVLEIDALGERRGPASEARALYRILHDSAISASVSDRQAAVGEE